MQRLKELCEAHPDIAIDPEMLGGVPHIKGTRLSVSNILEKLYLYGSVENIKELYGEDISEDQIKEAIAYAQDYLDTSVTEMKNFKPIKSGNLVEAAHDGENTMQVRFKNGLYEYSGVSPEKYREFEATFQTEASSGKFFSQNFRKMPYKKIS